MPRVDHLVAPWYPARLLRQAATATLACSAIVATLTLALVGGVTYATTRPATPTYHGCYNKKTGVLRLVTHVAPRCTRGESGIAWNQTGLQGPQGPQGPSGPQGPQGPAGGTTAGLSNGGGAPGPQGPQGPAGPKGDAGPQGAQGPQGPAGPTGPAGPQGAQGPAGPAGAKGDTGSAGAKGDTGSAGPQGAQGPAGTQGPQGSPGATGPQGPQGVQGSPGIVGIQYWYSDWSIPAGCAYTATSTCGLGATQCPTGTAALGGGYIVDSTELVAVASLPAVVPGGPTGWGAGVQNNDAFNAHTLEVWASCAALDAATGGASPSWHREQDTQVPRALLRAAFH